MRSRDALLILAVLAGLGVGACFLFWTRGPGEAAVQPTGATPVTAPHVEPQLAPIPEPADADRTERARVVAAAPEEQIPAPKPDAAATPAGLVVTGSVHFADDGTPAAGASFVLHHAAGHVVVHADDAGRFRTQPVVAAGIAELYHRPTAAAGAYPLRLRFEPASISLEGQPGAEAAVELILKRPAAELLVRVVHRDGRAAADAEVELESRREVRPGEFAHRITTGRTDAEGHARFALFDIDVLRALGLIARLDGGARPLVSPRLSVELPLQREQPAAPLVLVLDAAGSLLVRVRDEAGAPVLHERVWLSSFGVFVSDFAGEQQHSDEAGEVLFDALPPGTYIVSPPSHSTGTRPTVEVWPGARAELELVVRTSAERLAVAGRVVDEEGAPLAGVQVRALFGPRDGRDPAQASTTTDAEGHFELRSTPHAEVTVRTDRDIFGDEYTPASLEVPFGTPDLLFTRVREIAREQIDFEIVDALTSRRLPGALVMTYRAPHLGDYAFHRAPEGLASPLCALHPETTLVVELSGYRRATVALDELLAQEPIDGLRRIALDAGLLRRLHVVGPDATGEHAPIAGARVRLGERGLGSTDARGDLLLDLHDWPGGELTVEADGFEPGTWEPADGFADLEPAVVWLERE